MRPVAVLTSAVLDLRRRRRSGLDRGSTSRPTTYTHYDPVTGQADYTGTTAKPATVIPDAEKTAVFDTWGRPTIYRNDLGEATTTAYDAAGRVTTVTDPKGTTTPRPGTARTPSAASSAAVWSPRSPSPAGGLRAP